MWSVGYLDNGQVDCWNSEILESLRRSGEWQENLHNSHSIVVEDGRNIFRWEFVGGVADEQASLADGTVTDNNASAEERGFNRSAHINSAAQVTVKNNSINHFSRRVLMDGLDAIAAREGREHGERRGGGPHVRMFGEVGSRQSATRLWICGTETRHHEGKAWK